MAPKNRASLSPANVKSEANRMGTLLSYDEIPPWYQDNDCIRQGYRPVMESVGSCFESWTYLHNETINIFSHFLPAILAVLSQAYIYRYFSWYYPQSTSGDRAIIVLHLCATSLCFGLSAFYHTLMNHSARYSDLWGRIDYTGIIILILGAFGSGIYVGFYCEPVLQNTYWSMIGTLGSLTVYIVIHPSYQSRQYRTFRLSLFILTGLSAFAPIIHASLIFPLDQLNKQTGLPYYYAEGALIVAGAILYGTRYPEKLRPGYFDFFGSSHQIFHILVVFATFIHMLGVLDALDWNHQNPRCPVGKGPFSATKKA